MYTQLIDYLEVSSAILARLEMEYKYAAAKTVDKPEMIKFVASQLEGLSDHEVLGWQGGLDMIAAEGRQHPPTVPEILAALRKNGIANRPKIKRIAEKQIPFESVWESHTDEQHLEDVRAWLAYCPRKMPDVMLAWVLEQEESVKIQLRLIKKRELTNLSKVVA